MNAPRACTVARLEQFQIQHVKVAPVESTPRKKANQKCRVARSAVPEHILNMGSVQPYVLDVLLEDIVWRLVPRIKILV